MSQDRALESVIAEYLQLEADGAPPARASLFAEYRHLADQLRDFFATHDRLRSATESTLGPGDEGLATEPAREAFADYEILAEIDRGGMGIVYRARQRSLSRIVALKTIRSGLFANADEIMRFQREAQAAAALNHPGIVPVYEVGESQGMYFFSMPFIDGTSLAKVIEHGPVEPAEAARLVLAIAEAVEHAHAQGIVHRDLKPANILLDKSGQPRITDFGLAKSFGSDAQLTHSGQIVGTPAYMAPEQLQTPQDVSPLIDVYGLGAILYALLTGHAPYEAANAVEVLMKLRTSEPVRPRKLNRSIARSLQQICLRCLERQPLNRYISAADVAADLRRYLRGDPIAAVPFHPGRIAMRTVRSHPLLVAHLTSIGLILLIVVVTYVSIGRDPNYFWRYVRLLTSWGVVSAVCHAVRSRWPRLKVSVGTLWGLLDAGFVTAAIVMAQGPRGPLLLGYPLLLVASALFLQVRYVVLTTIITVVAYWTSVYLIRDEQSIPQYIALFTLGLIVMGLILGGLVGHIRSLSQLYEPRRPIGS